MGEEGEKQEIKQQIERAVCVRFQHFKDQADSLTLEAVRRLLEKDLGLEKFALDVHKRFIRDYLEKKMEAVDDCKPETSTENVDEDVHASGEAEMLPEQNETKIDPKKPSTGVEILEDSPIMGVLTPKSEVPNQESSVTESTIKKAIRKRADHFHDNSENITLAGVRRLLEEDLGLEKNTLDAFKKFISKEIDQVLSSPKGAKSVKNVKKKTSDNVKAKKSKKASSEEMSDSSHSESDEMEVKVKPRKEVASKKTSDNVKAKKSKKASSEEMSDSSHDEMEVKVKPRKEVASKKTSDNVKAKKSKKASSEEMSDSSHSESDEMEVKVKPRKEVTPKRNIKKTVQPKKRKISEESDSDISEKKQKKPAKKQKEEEGDNDEDGSQSEDGVEKTAQKKEKPAAGYGKRVENLKTVIKACGMSVAPVIYKKAKQVPEEKREAFIMKELEDILSREGLSINPSEKEIKDCKRRKDRARELEGIDMTNIISSSRRRSTFSFASPVTPVIRAKKEKVGAEDGNRKKNVKILKDSDDEDKEKEKEKEKDNNEEEEKKEKDNGEENKEKDDEEEEEEVEDEEEEEEEEEESESEEFNEDDDESD